MGHLNAYSVKPGDWVQRGRVIGYAGSTGRSTGVHVHYTVITEGTPKQYIDPYAFIQQVPKYMSALRSAQAQAVARKNVDAFKKQPVKVIDKDEDEEAPVEEAAPPDAEAETGSPLL
jgi:hypothetical protein